MEALGIDRLSEFGKHNSANVVRSACVGLRDLAVNRGCCRQRLGPKGRDVGPYGACEASRLTTCVPRGSMLIRSPLPWLRSAKSGEKYAWLSLSRVAHRK